MTISRRGFLGNLAGGAGAALVAGPARAGSHKHFSGHPGRYGLLHDTTLCVGCRSCETACQAVNHLTQTPGKTAQLDATIRRTSDRLYTVVNRYGTAADGQSGIYRKHQCMHCNEPCCVSVCFVKAFTKTPEGPVLYDPSVCVGCRYCVMVCPYDALAYEYDEPVTPRVVRCTMCYDRVKQGRDPACAEVCPTGAITFGRRDDLLRLARERMRKYPGRYLEQIFGEKEFGGTSWLTLAGVPFRQLGLPEGQSHTPIPELGASFLSLVPLILTIYPGLLLGFYAFAQRKDKLSKQQLEQALAETLAGAEEEKKQALIKAAQKAAKDKDSAVAAAVKQALAEAEKKAAEAKKEAAGAEKKAAGAKKQGGE